MRVERPERSQARQRTLPQYTVGGAGAGLVSHTDRSWLMSVVLATTCARRELHRSRGSLRQSCQNGFTFAVCVDGVQLHRKTRFCPWRAGIEEHDQCMSHIDALEGDEGAGHKLLVRLLGLDLQDKNRI